MLHPSRAEMSVCACVLLLCALAAAGPVGPLPNVTSLDLGLKEESCALGDVVYLAGDEVPGGACERCACAGGEVRCQPLRCEPRPGCKAVHRPDHCCPTYQCECEQEGRVYGNGEKLVDPSDPCRVCYCQGGEVVCRRIACFLRDDCQPRLVPGRCCPEYDNCPLRGVTSVHGVATVSSTPVPPVNDSAAAAPIIPPKPGITIKEITPVSEIPVINDVKVKEILPSPNMDVAEYSSSKSPLIPREVTSENSSDDTLKNEPQNNSNKSELKSTIEENVAKGGSESTPSRISLSTQDSINSEMYPSNIPSIIMMGPSEPINLNFIPTKGSMIEEEDPTLFDHNPAFPPIPDDLSVLGNHEDEILPEQHYDNENIPGINDVVMTNENIVTEAPAAKESSISPMYVTSSASEKNSEPDSSDASTTKSDAVSTTSPVTKESSMINLRSVLPTQILNMPSLIPDDTTDDVETTTDIPAATGQQISTDKNTENVDIDSVDGQFKNIVNELNKMPQTTESAVSYQAPDVSSTELFSENQPSSILIETSDQNPHDVSDKSSDNTLASSTVNPVSIDAVSDIISISNMEPGKDTSLETVQDTTEFILEPLGSQESATDGVELIKISPDTEKNSALIEPPRGRKNNVLNDLIDLVGDVASISENTDAPEHSSSRTSTISDSEELIPVNTGYKSKNYNRNVNSITEVPMKSKSQPPSKHKNVEIEDEGEADTITDLPPPNDKVEPTTKRPIIDNVSDTTQPNKNDTNVDKKDIEIITKSYVPTISKRPTKVVMETSNDSAVSSEAGNNPTASSEDSTAMPNESTLDSREETSTATADNETYQPDDTSRPQ